MYRALEHDDQSVYHGQRWVSVRWWAGDREVLISLCARRAMTTSDDRSVCRWWRCIYVPVIGTDRDQTTDLLHCVPYVATDLDTVVSG